MTMAHYSEIKNKYSLGHRNINTLLLEPLANLIGAITFDTKCNAYEERMERLWLGRDLLKLVNNFLYRLLCMYSVPQYEMNEGII